MTAPCKWCGARSHAKPMWHRNCSICLEPFTQERGIKRPRSVCLKPLCIGIQRYRWRYGRWPPQEWFIRYAILAGLIKIRLPREARKLMARCAA